MELGPLELLGAVLKREYKSQGCVGNPPLVRVEVDAHHVYRRCELLTIYEVRGERIVPRQIRGRCLAQEGRCRGLVHVHDDRPVRGVVPSHGRGKGGQVGRHRRIVYRRDETHFHEGRVKVGLAADLPRSDPGHPTSHRDVVRDVSNEVVGLNVVNPLV